MLLGFTATISQAKFRQQSLKVDKLILLVANCGIRRLGTLMNKKPIFTSAAKKSVDSGIVENAHSGS